MSIGKVRRVGAGPRGRWTRSPGGRVGSAGGDGGAGAAVAVVVGVAVAGAVGVVGGGAVDDGVTTGVPVDDGVAVGVAEAVGVAVETGAATRADSVALAWGEGVVAPGELKVTLGAAGPLVVPAGGPTDWLRQAAALSARIRPKVPRLDRRSTRNLNATYQAAVRPAAKG